MAIWTCRMFMLSCLLFVVGWALVLVFNDGGELSGVREAGWRVGGLMVYASLVTVPVTLLLAVLASVRRVASRTRRP